MTKTDQKEEKTLIYNPQHSFWRFKDINYFREISPDSMHKKLQDFSKKIY